ncbi:MAG: DUF262 domain-containing protein [Armatimonadetes bacterium]|nr:DUF262 domain-containing protein [Armatimonadota bacterium]
MFEQSLVQSGMIESRSVIDGQQRLTTLQVLLAAARAVSVEHRLENARQMIEKLLFNLRWCLKLRGSQFRHSLSFPRDDAGCVPRQPRCSLLQRRSAAAAPAAWLPGAPLLRSAGANECRRSGHPRPSRCEGDYLPYTSWV